MKDDESEKLVFVYTIQFEKGKERRFRIELDLETLAMVPAIRDQYPEWACLSHHQCANCPLDPEEHPRCPIAENLVEVVEVFGESISYEEVDVKVETPVRAYHKRVKLQKALTSMMGIYSVTSGCPILDKLRPMVENHLPFQTMKEANYRILTMYLFAQYVNHKKGRAADWDLKGLAGFLEEISKTNQGLCDRLNSIHIQDAAINALVNLDTQGNMTSLMILSDSLQEMEKQVERFYGESI